MKKEIVDGINKAMNQARIHGIGVSEVWLGPSDFQEAEPELEVRREDELYYDNLRVRQMVEDNIPRVGSSTCGEGPGVT